MSLVLALPRIIQESRSAYEAMKGKNEGPGFVMEEHLGYCGGEAKEPANMLACGDNLLFMEYLLDRRGMEGKLNLIYVDPPFFSKADYGAEVKLQSGKINKIPVMKQKAYHDTWEKGMEEYLEMLTLRFLFMKDLLAEDGCLWVHLDWHAVHYVKVILDEIFGEKNFINEIIWQYKSGGASKRRFARKHDTLLFYAKSPGYYFAPMEEKSYNRGFRPYRFKGVREYRDETGWYTMVNRKDVWQLDMVGRTSSERTGYATQKPESLITRILESCTRPGDLCADFFGGSGTLAAVANRMGRRWISCDIGRLAAVNAHQRLTGEKAEYGFYMEGAGREAKEQRTAVEATAVLEASPVFDKNILKIKLEGYKLNSLREIPVEEKHLPIIRRVLKEDPLQLVACWSVDYHYDGQVSRPQIYHCKKKDAIQAECEIIGEAFGPVALRVWDIFGNSAFSVMEAGEYIKGGG